MNRFNTDECDDCQYTTSVDSSAYPVDSSAYPVDSSAYPVDSSAYPVDSSAYNTAKIGVRTSYIYNNAVPPTRSNRRSGVEMNIRKDLHAREQSRGRFKRDTIVEKPRVVAATITSSDTTPHKYSGRIAMIPSVGTTANRSTGQNPGNADRSPIHTQLANSGFRHGHTASMSYPSTGAEETSVSESVTFNLSISDGRVGQTVPRQQRENQANFRGFIKYIFTRLELGKRFSKKPYMTISMILVLSAIHISIIARNGLAWDDKIPQDTHGVGNLEKIVVHGEVYRLLTQAFLHWNVSHLVANLSSILMSIPMEMENGSFLFITVFVLSSIGGNLLTVALHANSQAISVGASTGISGLLSIYISSAVINREDVKLWILRIVVTTSIFLLVISDVFIADGSMWTAMNHLFGFISAIPIAICLLPNERLERWELPIVLVSFVMLVVIFVSMPIYIWAIRNYSFLEG